jgi:hypothetical protein
MWLALRIGVLYAAPVVAVLVAVTYFVVLWQRVRRHELTRGAAARRFAWMVLLAPAAVLTVWGTGEMASYFAVGSAQYAFDPDAAGAFLLSLAPLAGYVLVPIVLLLGAVILLPVAPRHCAGGRMPRRVR